MGDSRRSLTLKWKPCAPDSDQENDKPPGAVQPALVVDPSKYKDRVRRAFTVSYTHLTLPTILLV